MTMKSMEGSITPRLCTEPAATGVMVVVFRDGIERRFEGDALPISTTHPQSPGAVNAVSRAVRPRMADWRTQPALSSGVSLLHAFACMQAADAQLTTGWPL